MPRVIPAVHIREFSVQRNPKMKQVAHFDKETHPFEPKGSQS